MHRIYLDHAATTPVDPGVLEAMRPYFLTQFGNASSPHGFGQEALKAVEDARQKLSEAIGAQPQEIIFTSSTTESANHAIFGVARRLQDKGDHIIISSIEHHAVLQPVRQLEKEGFRISYIPVDSYGIVDPQQLKQLITPKTILIAVLHANNEIGSVQPVGDIGRIAMEHGVYFFVDAAQTVGHIPVSVNDLHCDFLCLSAHKFYGPKGTGALYARQGTQFNHLLFGGDQERGRRASTLNVPGIVGLGKSIELALEDMPQEINRLSLLRDRTIQTVLDQIPGTKLNGHPQKRLPKNIHFSFEGVSGEMLIAALDMAGIAVSMGSACTSGQLEPSHVLKAVGLKDELALGSLRVGLGRWTTEEELGKFIEVLKEKVSRLRDNKRSYA